jgi:hypothetical protein
MEQIEITRRYLERIRQIYLGVPYVENKQYYADDVCSFFIHCYHIKDWILKLNRANFKSFGSCLLITHFSRAKTILTRPMRFFL